MTSIKMALVVLLQRESYLLRQEVYELKSNFLINEESKMASISERIDRVDFLKKLISKIRLEISNEIESNVKDISKFTTTEDNDINQKDINTFNEWDDDYPSSWN